MPSSSSWSRDQPAPADPGPRAVWGGNATTAYTVKYFRGATDITAAVVAGTYTTPTLAAGAKLLNTFKVKVASTAGVGSSVTRLVTITSVGDGTKSDAVQLVGKRSRSEVTELQKVRWYPGTPAEASKAFEQEVGGRWQVVSTSWASDGLLVVMNEEIAQPAPEREASRADRLRLGLLVVGALLLAFAGWSMIGLKSQSGDSVAEYFYKAMGWASFGLAAVAGYLAMRDVRHG